MRRAFIGVVLLLPLVLAQAASLQSMLDAAQPGAIVQLPEGAFEGPALVAKPLTILGVDQRTTLSAPVGSGAIVVAEANVTLRFLDFAQGDRALDVGPGRVALVGPVRILAPGGIRLQEGATLLMRNDPGIPLAIDATSGARALFTRPTLLTADDARTSTHVTDLRADLISPEGALVASFGPVGGERLEVDVPVQERRGETIAPVADGWTFRVGAKGYHDASVPLASVGTAPLALEPDAAPAPEPTPLPDATSSTQQAVSSSSDPQPEPQPEPGSSSSPSSVVASPQESIDLVEASTIEAPSVADEPGISPVEAAAIAASVGLASAAVGGTLLLRSERRLWKLVGLLAPLYTRLKKSELLDSSARERIHAHVEANPGVRYRELQRALGLPNGALAHHLRILLRERLIEEAREGQAVRFFAPGSRPDAPIDTGERVLAFVREHPGATGADVARALDLSVSLAGYHLQKLDEAGRIRRAREGVRVRAYPAPESPTRERQIRSS